MIVVDVNVIAYLFIPGPFEADARAAVRKDPEWVSPPLWRSEFRNVLALYLRIKELSLDEALSAMKQAEHWMREGERAVASAAVLSLAAASPCTAYDCEYVALAQEMGVGLVTCDKGILGAFPDVAMSLHNFAQFAD